MTLQKLINSLTKDEKNKIFRAGAIIPAAHPFTRQNGGTLAPPPNPDPEHQAEICAARKAAIIGGFSYEVQQQDRPYPHRHRRGAGSRRHAQCGRLCRRDCRPCRPRGGRLSAPAGADGAGGHRPAQRRCGDRRKGPHLRRLRRTGGEPHSGQHHADLRR